MNKRLFVLMLLIYLTNGMTQDFDSTRIYINPGHGGNDPANDRYIEETGFWESEGNLTKGLYLRALLKSSNAVVFMSRTKNREQDDLPLSQIDADANANNADFFHSIHSNGWQGQHNYTLMLYRGYDNEPVFPLALDMSSIMAKEIYHANRTTSYSVRGDWSFYSSWGDKVGLGVLRTLEMPGTLSEGSFHDYIPESWRLQSLDYRKHEALAIYRSFVKLLDLAQPSHGAIAGIVRDANQQVLYDFRQISSLPNDKLRAINETEVVLLPDSLVYKTDLNKNGFFVFDSLQAGNYKLVFNSGEHKTDTLDVETEANITVFADAFLKLDPGKAPYVDNVYPEVGSEDVITHTDIEIIFSRSMDADITGSAFSISPQAPGAISWVKSNQKLIFTPQDALSTSTEYTVALSTEAKSEFDVAMEEDYSFSFTTAADHVYPQMVDHYPSGIGDSVLTDTEVSIQFSMSMRQQETENAFSIKPVAAGTFSWANNNKTLTYTPDQSLLADTTYTISISIEALNRYGIPLKNAASFNFKTRKRNQLNIVNTYPSPNKTGISPYLHFYVEFDAPIQTSTIGNKIRLYENGENYTRCNAAVQYQSNGKHYILFDPRSRLKNNTWYQLLIVPGILDAKEISMKDSLNFFFKTQPESYASGNIFDDFESMEGWPDPDNNEGTMGTDTIKTEFLIDFDERMNGSYSGKLKYVFKNDSGGVCQLYNASQVTMPEDKDSEFGLWVFGDYSQNLLGFWFENNNQQIYKVIYDTINWSGWKLVRFPVEQIGSEGQTYFNSIVVKQSDLGLKESTLYFDDLQYDITVPINNYKTKAPVAKEFKLYQNYPNPFNPFTNIKYYIKQQTEVELVIYNIIGKKIATLVKGIHSAGEYKVVWQANHYPSGIYFCKLKTGSFERVRKLILLK